MNRNQNLLEYYKAARESMQCLFIKDIKRINKKIEKYIEGSSNIKSELKVD